MKAQVTGRVVVVTLSHKNLLDLVAQSMSGRGTVALVRHQDDGVALYLYAEANDAHYAVRDAGPGSGLVA